MKRTEKIIVFTILALAIIHPVLLFQTGNDIEGFIDLSLIVLVAYYFKTTKPSVVFVVFSLIITGLIGHALLNVMEMFLYMEMSLYVASIIFGIIVIIKLYQEKNKSMFYYVAALALIVQGILFLLGDPGSRYYALLVNYLIVGVIGSIKMNEMKLNDGIDKGLTFYLVAALIPVIVAALSLVFR